MYFAITFAFRPFAFRPFAIRPFALTISRLYRGYIEVILDYTRDYLETITGR